MCELLKDKPVNANSQYVSLMFYIVYFCKYKLWILSHCHSSYVQVELGYPFHH